MSKQEASPARSVAELEQKLSSKIENVDESKSKELVKTNRELNNFKNATLANLETMQGQIDGKITTWFYSEAPTLLNLPASEWATNEEKSKHRGDLYYDRSSGYAYIFELENNDYKWTHTQDGDISEALAIANAAQDTADNKRRVFVIQPTVPYDTGDLWINNHEIYRCQLSKTTGSYSTSDWINDLKYTDDTKANAVEGNLDKVLKELVIKLNITSSIFLWFFSGIPDATKSPEVNWTTNEEKNSHVGDIYYDKQIDKVYTYKSNYSWEETLDPSIIQAIKISYGLDTTDTERKVFVSTPTVPYGKGDWWIKENGELYVSIKTEVSEYNQNDFIISSLSEVSVMQVLSGTVTTITSNFVKFTDLSTGGSTTIAGENITTGSIKSANYIQNLCGTLINLLTGIIDTKNFKVDEDGNVKLSNGAKIIGENGLMNTYLYNSGNYFSPVGFMGDAPLFPSAINKERLLLELSIPTGLNVTSAKIKLFHTPMKWSVIDNGESINIWGYSRNVKLYKATNLYNRQFIGEYCGGYNENDNTSYSEILDAFGEDGYTASVPNSLNYKTEEASSIDISSSFKDLDGNTISGIHQLKIETGNNADINWSDSDIASRTGFMLALLKIDGYMSYLDNRKISTENNNIINTENGDILIMEGE